MKMKEFGPRGGTQVPSAPPMELMNRVSHGSSEHLNGNIFNNSMEKNVQLSCVKNICCIHSDHMMNKSDIKFDEKHSNLTPNFSAQ